MKKNTRSSIVYDRQIGAISSLIPAIFYLLLMVSSNALTSYNLVWLVTTFTPLIIGGGYLDILLFSYFMSKFNLIWIRIILSWVLLFPLARLFSEVSLSYIFNLLIDIPTLFYFLIASTLFGFIYGFFFYTAYNYLLKLFKRG